MHSKITSPSILEAPVRLQVCRAVSDPHRPVGPAVIDIAASLPDMTLDAARRLYRRQAAKIADALNHLPGGTLHQLRIELMTRHTNLLRVPEDIPAWLPMPVRVRARQLAQAMVANPLDGTVLREVHLFLDVAGEEP